MDWLEEKLRDTAAVQRLRRQPWILSALLKPFFGRAVEQRWSTGRTIHFRSLSVAVETTRPLRQRALAIVDRLLGLNEVVLCHAVIPVIVEAIHPVYSGFGFQPTPKDQEAWRPDRLEAVKRVERVMASHRDEPVLLLRLREVLWKRSKYDPDELVGEECRRVRVEMPDTFELRVVRVLSSFARNEISVKTGPTLDADLKAAEARWAEFRQSVAREIVDQFKTAKEVCEFVSRMVLELAATNSVVLGGALFEPIAQISPGWCAGLLEELLTTPDPTLDWFLLPVLGEASRHSPEAYLKALESLPAHGRPQQVCALVSFLGWKRVHGGGLTQLERQCVLASAKRTEEAIVAGVASTAGLFFASDPQWTIGVLSALKPTTERGGYEIVQALGFLVDSHAPLLDPKKVAECLANVGQLCFSERLSDEGDLDKVAQAFPKQVYQQVRAICERAEVEPAGERGRMRAAALSLGPVGDAEYVDREIRTLWAKAASGEKASFSQAFRLALIRSLLWADPATAPERLRGLIAGCKNGNELELVTELAATRSSRFVFEFPDIVRSLLARGEDLAVAVAVRQTLWLSACGGGRSYSEHELDPEYRYILEQGEALANRYRDDPVLHKFYRMVAESERHQMERDKRTFQAEDDMD